MKNTPSKLLTAATLIILLTAGQSAMAMSQDSGDYDVLTSNEQVVQPTFIKLSHHIHAIGNSENGIDSAYVRGAEQEVFTNQSAGLTRDLFDTIK